MLPVLPPCHRVLRCRAAFNSGRSKSLGTDFKHGYRRLCRIQQHSFVGLHNGSAVSRPILFDRHHRARNYRGDGPTIVDQLCAKLLFCHGSLPLFGTGRAQCCRRRFGQRRYFSVDNGVTNLGTWNNNPNNGDLGDWYGSPYPAGGKDAANDYAAPGIINVFSASDITDMQAIGWTVARARQPRPLLRSRPTAARR